MVPRLKAIVSLLSKAGDVGKASDDPNRRILLLIRLLFLTYYGALGSIIPYMSVYYHSLGHGGDIIGILGAIKPFTSFWVAPLWGLLSDRSKNPVVILQFTLIVSVMGQVMVGMKNDPFYIMMVVCFTSLFSAPIKTLLDNMTLRHIPDRSSYGRLRLYGQVGYALGTYLIGLFMSGNKPVSSCSSEVCPATTFDPSKTSNMSEFLSLGVHWFRQNLTGFRPIFLAHAILAVPAWLCIQALETMERKQQQRSTTKPPTTDGQCSTNGSSSTDKTVDQTSLTDALHFLAQRTDAMIFFFSVLMIGINAGVNDTFAYVRIRELGGTGKEMGLCRIAGATGGAPMFWFSSWVTQKFPIDQLLVIVLSVYVLRFVSFSLISNPYHAIPFEALRGAAFAIFMSSTTVHAHKIAPPRLKATMLMLVNCMYAGLGQTLGALVSGKLQYNIGTVHTFRCFALLDLGLIALGLFYLAFRKDFGTNPVGGKIKTL